MGIDQNSRIFSPHFSMVQNIDITGGAPHRKVAKERFYCNLKSFLLSVSMLSSNDPTFYC